MKADTLSLTSWQAGMYGFMAVARLRIFARVLDAKLHVNSVEFWLWFGLATSYPVNRWLIAKGIKEKM